MAPKTTSKKYFYSIGRRREARAAVKLFSGKGDSLVNGIKAESYFPGNSSRLKMEQPFTVTENTGKYYFEAVTSGGGKNGQLTALSLAISRSLVIADSKNSTSLRTSGLLTVDSRVRQRRMVGTGGKARRQKQSPKR